jgi:cytochrome oxidase Cu insertion factor (SCO1/SenC/PrrC family)
MLLNSLIQGIKMKKAQGLSITVVIVAAIALIVLVVLVLVFTGKIGGVSKEADACTNVGGECLTANECKGSFQTISRQGKCYTDDKITIDSTKVCCITIGAKPAAGSASGSG